MASLARRGTTSGPRRSSINTFETGKNVGDQIVEPADLSAGKIELFLYVDGTLLDLVPRREAVVVKPELLGDSQAAQRSLGGALALFCGCFFAMLRLCAAGVHVQCRVSS
jgi:hypothetical protein